jgi:hypothetical protein
VVEETVLKISRSRPLLAPLALTVGGFAMVFHGLRLVFTNWRLTLLQVLPAMWIWLATFDLKLHVLHGHSYHSLRGPILIPLALPIVAITAAAFYLDGVFAFAISRRGEPDISDGFARARAHRRPILGYGVVVGLMLAFSVLVAARWGRPWYALCLGVVIGIMTVCYVAIPSRLIGGKPTHVSRRDRWAATAVSATIGTIICTPPYLLGRLGILMLGSRVLFIPGLVLLTVGATVQAGATGAVNAVKMSTKLTAGDESDAAPPAPPAPTASPAPPAGQPG